MTESAAVRSCYAISRMEPRDSADSNRPAYSEDGVDLTLIRWMLTLTPLERLEALQDAIESIRRLRGEAAEG